MRYFLDSSALVSLGLSINSQKLEAVIAQTRSEGIVMVTASLVIEETTNKYREQLTKHVAALTDSSKNLNRMAGFGDTVEITALQIEEWVTDYKEKLLSLFEGVWDISGEVFEYPEVDHAEIAQRAMRGTKPYGQGTKDSYRDTLIWFSFLEVMESYPDDDIVLVTENIRDFTAKVEGNLRIHPELVEDIRSRGLRPSKASVLPSLDELFERHAEHTLTQLTAAQTEIESGEWSARDLKDDTRSTLESYLQGNEGELNRIFGHGIFDEPEWIDMTNIAVYDLQITSASANTLVGGYQLDFTVEIEVEAEMEVYRESELGEYYRDRFDNEGSYITVTDTATGTAIFSVVYSATWEPLSTALSLGLPEDIDIVERNYD